MQFLSDGDRIYVSVEYREGTGHFYAGSHYVSAIPGKEDSMELMDEEAAAWIWETVRRRNAAAPIRE